MRTPNATPKRMDFFDRADVQSDLSHIDALLKGGILDSADIRNPLLSSVFIDVLICLRDLMHKTQKYAKRIDFTDDVTVKGKVTDVSSLIKYVRDAMCHRESENHYLEPRNIKASFEVVGPGSQGPQAITNDYFELSNPYDDDICFYFGSQRIFLRRHIRRALEESRTLLSPLLNQPRWIAE